MARISFSLNSIMGPLTSRISHIVALILVAAAFALLIVVDATAPVNHGLALFTAKNDHIRYNEGRPVVHFGTFGYCFQVVADPSSTYDSTTELTPDRCSPSGITYNAISALSPVSPALGASTITSYEQRLTSSLVLHPLATGFSFLLLISLFLPARLAPPLVALLLASLTTALVLAALVCDFVLFSRIKRRLANQYSLGRGAYDVGIWAVVAAFVCLFISTILLGLRWWVQRLLKRSAGVKPGSNRETELLEQQQDEGKTNELSSAPSYELSQGVKADRHELVGGQGRRVELGDGERHELDTPATYSEPKSRVGEELK